VSALASELNAAIARPWLVVVAIASVGLAWIASVLHYTGVAYGNPIAWLAWLVAIAALLASCRFEVRRPALGLRRFAGSDLGVALLVVALYLPTHLWNFDVAPWNSNGLFDDAAWDISFAKLHAFNGVFQPAFFDEVGYISREVLFHYYITVFFKLFGYNLLVFNVALLVLGLVTVLGTTLIVHRLFRSAPITVAAALLINFLPLQYLHIFVGHRYAIAAPTMVASLYFLYAGFQDRSFAKVGMSGLFAALCLGSSIMGKQYIAGLAGAAVLLPILDRDRWRSTQNRALGVGWLVAFLISATPLLAYIVFNPVDYFRRDQGLVTEFLDHYRSGGLAGVLPYFSRFAELFLAPATFSRMWVHDFPLIPFAEYVLLLPGLVLAALRRHLELTFLALIPVASALIGGAFDFRVVLAAPIWVVCMAFTLDAVRRVVSRARRPIAMATAGAATARVLLGAIPAAAYLWTVSLDSNRQYLLPHVDVAVGRLFQDLAAGAATPTYAMKQDEFQRTSAGPAVQLLACPLGGYAITHLYLQDFSDRRIMAFCDQGNERLLGPDVLRFNVAAVRDLAPSGMPVKLAWERSDLSEGVIAQFVRFETLGSGQTFSADIDGRHVSVYVLTIDTANVQRFRDEVLAAFASETPA